MSTTSDFANKTALITGGSIGIGLSVAHKLALRGCSLTILSRSEGEIGSLRKFKEKGDIGGEISWKKCDVTSETEVDEAVQSLRRDGRRIDFLINNAGMAIGAPHTFWDQPLADVHKMIATNVLGLVNVTHAVLKNFLIPSKKGTVLNISSITGLEVPQKGMGEVIYHACKSFMEGFTNSLRNETVGTDIRVLALRPGFVKTHFHFQRVGRDERAFEGIFEGTEPLQADDIAEAAVWMLQQPDRVSIKAMDVLPSAQRSLSVVDKEWNRRRGSIPE